MSRRSFPGLDGFDASRRPPNLLFRQSSTLLRRPSREADHWETGMPMYNTTTELRRFGLGKNHQELAQFIEGHINRVANGRIRDLHVVYSEEKIILQGRSRTYHAKQLAHQAVLDLTDGHPLLANQIVVS